MAGYHPCAVPNCPVPAKVGQLMCRDHWFMVRQTTRRDINHAWRNYRKDPKRYTALRNKGIAEVVEKETARGEPRLI